MATLIQDLRYGLRTMARNPGFTAVAVLTLALGIGANSAIFSVADSVLLRPLPFKDPDRLVLVWGSRPHDGWDLLPVSYQNFSDWRDRSRSFDSLSAFFAYQNTTFNLTGGGEPERIQAAYFSAGVFQALGVAPALGRAFSDEEDRPGAEGVVVISHGLWQRRSAGDAGLIGKSLVLDGRPCTVVGVMPPGFSFPRFPKDPDVWLPLSLDPHGGRRFSRGTNYLTVVGRLKPDVTVAQAQSEMDSVARGLAAEYPRFNTSLDVRVTPLARQAAGSLRPALLALLGAVGLVLLIACANVANLLLSRAKGREREVAVRLALGAGRARLIRQWLTESALLAVMGGGVGILLASWGVDLLSFIPYAAPTYFAPWSVAQDQIAVSGRVLGFTFLLSLLTGMFFGLAPALHAVRADFNPSLKDGGGSQSGGPRRRRAQDLLVVAEIALSLVLLVGAGLMIRSFRTLSGVDPGFKPGNVVTAEISLPPSKYPEGRQVSEFYEQLLSRITSLPDVRAAGAAMALPLGESDESTGFIPERPTEAMAGAKLQVHPRAVTPGYLEAMGIPMRAGRPFAGADGGGGAKVAIVNEAMSRRFWPGESPIGRRVALDYEAMKFFPDRPPERDLPGALREIVGVVADVRHSGLDAEAPPEMYVPLSQHPSMSAILVVRTGSDDLSFAAALRGAVRAIDKDQPVANVRTMSRILEGSVARPRFNSTLFTIFASVALILSMVGVYGVMSYSVSQRTREIGVRVALGARSGDVLRMVLREGFRLSAAGVALGLAGAFALTRVLSSLLFGVSATDAATFVSVALLLVSAALLACWIPARRAMKVDPIVALRCE